MVGIETRATSHHWSRELQALGHTVSLDPAGLCQTVCETAEERLHPCRSDLRGSGAAEHSICTDEDDRAAEWLVLHRTRSLLIRQQTSVINGHLAEFGIVAPVGRNGGIKSPFATASAIEADAFTACA